ncbi:gluzincin family metallopeptidase, partial [Fusobacterium necrophorum]
AQNPFFEKYSTPHGTTPFNKIKTEHFEPAIKEGIRRQANEINAIANDLSTPTFENTVLAYEKSGQLLGHVTTVFGNLRGAETNEELQKLAREMSPLLNEHYNNIMLNEKLFERIKSVYEQREKTNLTAEQQHLVKET